MSDISQSFGASSISGPNKAPKSKADYSRNVKKLKIKLSIVQNQINDLQKKINAYSNTSNDKMIAMKISKFCKQRRMTPQMLFRFADKYQKKQISKNDLEQTLQIVGIKLTKHQITRIQYLLDQDLSGVISWHEFNSFLYAFGIKGQYSADEQFMKEALKKLDLDKILKIADQNKDKNRDPNKKKRQLLNYEEFLKYCHRHMPNLKDKEIASIFNRLQKNGLIDLDDFIEYMKRKEEQRKRLEEKNNRDKNKGKNQKVVEIEQDQTKTLRGIIKAIIRNRPKDSKAAFHSSEFQRLEKKLGKQKGQLMQLFRLIDKAKKGSFGFNQLINYYITKEMKGYLSFTYQLMGKKISLMGHKPEDVINQYNGCRNKIDKNQFCKFMKQEFETIETDSIAVFYIVAKQNTVTTVREILDAMKLEQGQKKIVYIKPTTWKTHGKDFYRKGQLTLLFNPFVALRFCISIMEELNKSKQTHWDDFQFGPTFEDPFGSFSLGRQMPFENVKWNSVTALGMNEFYYGIEGKKYTSTVLCPHEIFCKSLDLLVNQSENYLWYRNKIEYNIKQIKSQHLQILFHGVYPLAFHSFAQYGVYVFKFFVKNRWIYALVDNKIPCNLEDEPLFSTAFDKRHSWVSLIEKAYSKVKGSYQQMFEVNSISQYLFEMTNKLPIEISLPPSYKNEQSKNQIWKYIQSLQQNQKNQLYSLVSDAAAHRLLQGNDKTGIHKNKMYRLEDNIQIADKNSQNSHKSHRLLLFKDLDQSNPNLWNTNWYNGAQKNKYTAFQAQIQKLLKKREGNAIKSLKDKNVTIMNFKLFRTLFDKIFTIKQVSYQKMMILRKIVQFQEKHKCKYELSSKQPNNGKISMILALSARKVPPKAIIEVKLKNSKDEVVFEDKIKGMFGCCQLSFDNDLHMLELNVKQWISGQDYAYSLSFYMQNPRYHLKQLDRQLLFDFIGKNQQSYLVKLKDCDEKQKTFIYRNFYKAAERSGGCCG